MTTTLSYSYFLERFLLLVLAVGVVTAEAEPKADRGSVTYLEFADIAPYYYKRGGGYQGTTVDMVKSLLEPSGYNVKIQMMAPERIFNEALADNGDVLMLHTYPGLALEDYPDGMLVCPHKISRVPIRYYTNNIRYTHMSREEIVASRIGVFRYANFQRGFTKGQELSNITRFNNMRYMYRALLANRVDVVIAGPYTMRVLSLEHEAIFPYELDMDLGFIEGYLAVTKVAEQRLGIYQALCERASRWDVDEDFVENIGRHLNAFGNFRANSFE